MFRRKIMKNKIFGEQFKLYRAHEHQQTKTEQCNERDKYYSDEILSPVCEAERDQRVVDKIDVKLKKKQKKINLMTYLREGSVKNQVLQ